ncbi:MAG: rhomboid family intramembrane serine protease, partial [Flavobacteriales bacterium]
MIEINFIKGIGTIILSIFFLLFKVDPSFLTHYLAASSDIVELFLKPWTMITYMFYHEQFFHILFNMLILYFSGMIFDQNLGESRLVSTYILGGLSGLFLYVVSYNIFPL